MDAVHEASWLTYLLMFGLILPGFFLVTCCEVSLASTALFLIQRWICFTGRYLYITLEEIIRGITPGYSERAAEWFSTVSS